MPPRRGATPQPQSPARPCDAPGCTANGEFRAPKSRTSLNEYVWFCLPHVREYNSAWDYYKGMGPNEIEANLRHDTSWQRPTWPLGRLGGGHRRLDPEFMRDPLGLLYATPLHARRTRSVERPTAPPELRAALDVLGLEWPLDQLALRTRYRELAKKLHPDVNGRDRAAEERLKDVNRAYSLLRQRVDVATPVPEPAEAGAAT
jgi:hypothetical protein